MVIIVAGEITISGWVISKGLKIHVFKNFTLHTLFLTNLQNFNRLKIAYYTAVVQAENVSNDDVTNPYTRQLRS